MANGIIFDLDGTLMETRDGIVFAFNEALAGNGFEKKEPGSIRALIGTPLEEMFSIAVGEGDVEKLCDDYRSIYREASSKMSRPYPNVRETLEALGDYPLAIATTKNTAIAKELCDAHELSGFFDAIIGGDMAPKKKPAPDIVLLAAERIGVKPDNAMMVGDTRFDMLAGRAAGSKACGATYGFGTEQELRESGADYLIGEFAQLERVVREWLAEGGR